MTAAAPVPAPVGQPAPAAPTQRGGSGVGGSSSGDGATGAASVAGAEAGWSSDPRAVLGRWSGFLQNVALVLLFLWYMELLGAAVKWGGIVFGGMLLMLYFKQGGMLYAPNPQLPPGVVLPRDLSPSVLGLPYTNENIVTADGTRIHAWLITQPGMLKTKAPTVLFFHGNAGPIDGRLRNYAELYAKLGVNVMAVDYRGYGRSSGTPSERGLQMDARGALEHLCKHEDVDPDKIVVFGRSLGGAVALWLAANVAGEEQEALGGGDAGSVAHRQRPRLRGVIVENTFTGVGPLASRLIPWVKPILNVAPFFLTNKWESIESVKRVTCPILFLSGSRDELIPPQMMHDLRGAATQSKSVTFHSIEGGGHNNSYTVGGDEYYEQVGAFLKAHVT